MVGSASQRRVDATSNRDSNPRVRFSPEASAGNREVFAPVLNGSSIEKLAQDRQRLIDTSTSIVYLDAAHRELLGVLPAHANTNDEITRRLLNDVNRLSRNQRRMPQSNQQHTDVDRQIGQHRQHRSLRKTISPAAPSKGHVIAHHNVVEPLSANGVEKNSALFDSQSPKARRYSEPDLELQRGPIRVGRHAAQTIHG